MWICVIFLDILSDLSVLGKEVFGFDDVYGVILEVVKDFEYFEVLGSSF